MSQLIDKLMSRVECDLNTGCWLWSGPADRKGYGHVWWKGRHRTAHRVSYEEQVGPISGGLHVCHRCDTPACVNPAHLWLGTGQDNVDDRVAKGRSRSGQGRGETNSANKLTSAEVLEIRAAEAPQKVLAANYGVDQSLISLIRRRKIWAHL